MNNRKYFLVFCILSMVLVGIIFGINSIMRGTNASFGGVTGVLGSTYKITYYANWPDDSLGDDSNEYEVGKIYQILSNMYAVPSGYEFLGWGTEPDGLVVYEEGHVMSLSDNLNLYAIWGLVDTGTEDDNNQDLIAYGDVNLDDKVDENDYLLIDNYLLDNSLLSGQALINADVNTDGKVDNVDSDIIKQACLGTLGYVGILPDNPILIYELYVDEDSKEEDKDNEDNTDNENTSSENENSNNASSGGTGTGSGNGGGTAGSGNATSGGGNGSGNKNNGSTNGNTHGNSSPSKDDENKNEEEELPKIYEFKFMNGNMEYAITKCDILQDGTCELILPSTVPSKSGYVFKGWSLDSDCSKNIIKESMAVNSGATYYACYLEVNSEEQEKNGFNIWIIIGIIWILASMLIYRIVKQFKNKEENN